MINYVKRRMKKIHQMPGTALYTGTKEKKITELKLIKYNKDEYKEEKIIDFSSLESKLDKNKINWIEIKSAVNEESIKKICQIFNIHRLVMEDILNTSQTPNIQNFVDYYYIVLNKISKEKDNVEQISFIYKNNILISFQESSEDIFIAVKERLSKNQGLIRNLETDYLLFCLLDDITDNYFFRLERISDEIEIMENDIIKNNSNEVLEKIYEIKREALWIRKNFRYLKEALFLFERKDYFNISKDVLIYYRDLYDKSIRLLEVSENFRENISDLTDLHMSMLSNKMNTIMQTLTTISTIFIPLSFLAGLYGMNFEFMPELKYKYSYPILILLMIFIVIFMLRFFKKKKWF